MATTTLYQPLMVVAGLALAFSLAGLLPASADQPLLQQYTYSPDDLLFPTDTEGNSTQDWFFGDDDETAAWPGWTPESPSGSWAGVGGYLPGSDPLTSPLLKNELPNAWVGSGWLGSANSARSNNTRVLGRPYRSAGYDAPWQPGQNLLTPIQGSPRPRTGGHPYARAGFLPPWQAGVFYRNP